METLDRKTNLAAKDKKLQNKLSKLFDGIEKGFEAQTPRADDIVDYWQIYNCQLGPGQLFTGRNKLFVPIVYEAIQARATRSVNQLFPQSGKHIDCSTTDGKLPRAQMAVAEHYVDDARLREIMPALWVAGDVEGQYNAYVFWQEGKRHLLSRVEKPVQDRGLTVGKAVDILEETTEAGGPRIELISDADICVRPAVVNSVEECLRSGGDITIIRRWTKDQINEKIDSGDIDKKAGEELIENIDQHVGSTYRDQPKKQACAAGVKKDGRGKWALVYEIWTEIETDEGKRLCQIFMAGRFKILMARRNPLWCDRCPLLSVPVKKLPGSFKGIAPVSVVAKLQYFANDIVNQTADSTNLAQCPIFVRDSTEATPLVAAPGAIWEGKVTVLEMPPLWQSGMETLAAIKAEIFQVLSVNPANITQSTKKKMNQAEVAQEQQVDILTTNDSVRVLEEGVLTPIINLFMDLDYQYRDKELIVRQYGEMGMTSNLEQLKPFELRSQYMFRWIGSEATRSAQQLQQKIAALNIIQNIPPQLYPGYVLDVQPLLLDIANSVYGPQLSRLILKDQRSQLSIDPETENALMDQGHYTPVHPMDNHQEHMASHSQSIQQMGDPTSLKMVHLQEHQTAMMIQAQAQAMAQMGQGGQQGNPGPQPGAQPSTGRPAQGPPGMIAQDQMQDPSVMPRKM